MKTNETRMTKMTAVWKYELMKVALRPPAIVYGITKIGMRKPAA